MIERYGVRGTEAEGVFFAESAIPGARVVRSVHVEISRQNASLREVKQALAIKAKEAGANAVANFTYGQRKHEWWQLFLLKWDTESWHGEGNAVIASSA